MNHSSSPACSSHPATSTAVPAFAEADYDLLVSFDGAMEPRDKRRAQGAWGFVVVDAGGREIFRQSALMPRGACASNNVAEYTALLEALAWVKTHAVGQKVLFQGDSQLVVHHCRGTWGWNQKKTQWQPHKNAPHLKPLLDAAMAALKNLPALSTKALPPGPEARSNNLPIVWVAGAANPADGESRRPLVAAGLWKE